MPNGSSVIHGSMATITLHGERLKQATRRDPLLAKVMLALQLGHWPKPLTEEFVPFQRRAEELAVVKGLVMWGQRVIIPLCLRNKVKHELHEGHFGSQRMKSLARSYYGLGARGHGSSMWGLYSGR